MSAEFNGEVWTNVHPDILRAICDSNCLPADGKVGSDTETKRAEALMQAQFSAPVHIVETINGTAANVLALKCMLPPWGSVLCADETHVNTHECAAAEYNLGAKIITSPSRDGRLTVEQVSAMLERSRDYHWIPSVLTLTQPTECGVLYKTDELAALTEFAHANRMAVYVDGARIAYALAALDTDFRSMIEMTDIDAFSFGGTKCGAMFGEMVVFRRAEYAENLAYLQKQSMQHFDKSKFLGVQLAWLLEDEHWRAVAKRANSMAQVLKHKLAGKSVTPFYPVETNMVFCRLAQEQYERVRSAFDLHYWNRHERTVRFCMSHETAEESIERLVSLL